MAIADPNMAMLDAEDEMSAGQTPNQMRYSELMQRAVPGHSQSLRLLASNGSVFAPNGASQIRIPLNIAHGGFIDTDSSVLKVDIQCQRTVPNSGSAVAVDALLDGGIAACIDILRIEAPNGSILEEIRGYNLLNANLNKFIRSPEVAKSFTHQFDGSSEDGSPLKNDGVAWAAITGGSGGTVQQSSSKTFTLQLSLSGILSSHRYFPAGYTTGTACHVVIQLAPASDALCLMPQIPQTATNASFLTNSAASVEYTLSNVEYLAQIVRFQSETEALFSSMISQVGGIQMDFSSPHHVSTTSLAADSSRSATQWVVTMPIRTRNTNAVFHLIQELSDRNSVTSFSLSSLRARQATTYQHRLGGELMPQQPIRISSNNVAHSFYETVRCFKSPSDLHSACMIQRPKGSIASANLSSARYVGRREDVTGLVANADVTTASASLVVKSASGSVTQIGPVGTRGVLRLGGGTVYTFTVAASNTLTLGVTATWAADDGIEILSIDSGDGDDPGIDTLCFFPTSTTTVPDPVCSFVPALALQSFNDAGILSGQDYSSQTLNLELLLNCSHGTSVSQCQSYVLASGVVTLTADGQMFSSL